MNQNRSATQGDFSLKIQWVNRLVVNYAIPNLRIQCMSQMIRSCMSCIIINCAHKKPAACHKVCITSIHETFMLLFETDLNYSANPRALMQECSDNIFQMLSQLSDFRQLQKNIQHLRDVCSLMKTKIKTRGGSVVTN